MASSDTDLQDLLDSALHDCEKLELDSRPAKGVAEENLSITCAVQGLEDAQVADTLETRQFVQDLQSSSNDEGVAGEKRVEDLLSVTQDMLSMIDTMMCQILSKLLSKEIVYEPMKEVDERYLKWLEENKASINNKDYKRYSDQHALIKQLCEVYDIESNNFDKIIELVLKMQECGQPPSDIVPELAPFLDLGSEDEKARNGLLADNPASLCTIM